MTTPFFPYGRQAIDQDDIKAVADALESPYLTTGPRVEAFESQLCALTGARFAVACASGTAALHLACLALGITENDLGLTSPISFLASANCMEFCGGKVDFIDIDAETLCLSPEKLEQYCLTQQVPKVVILVDFAGAAADLPAIKKLSDRFGFRIIEDAAHALGSTYGVDGKSFACGSCTHSDLAVLSFHPVKTITTGEGGAVLTNDEALADRLRTFRNHGMVHTRDDLAPWYYEMTDLGYNYRITDIQCGLGLSQLNKLARFKKRRQQIVAAYNRAFQSDRRLILPPQSLEHEACPHIYPIQFDRPSEIRQNIYLYLMDTESIRCQVHYIPIYWQPYYAKKYGYQKGKCPAAEAYYARCLTLPLFPAMTDGDIDRVIAAVFRGLSVPGFN